MTTMSPINIFYHNDRHILSAGGTYGDSKAGTKQAKRLGYHRGDWDITGMIDDDGMLRPVNAHGSPFLPRFIRGSFTEYKWKRVHLLHPSLRDARKMFKHARRFLGHRAYVEAECKDLHPNVAMKELQEFFAKLRNDAITVWGDDWQRHVCVKVLTNLRGGMRYAIKVLKAAHSAGFDTMILPRGEHKHIVIDKPYITWNRGGRVK